MAIKKPYNLVAEVLQDGITFAEACALIPRGTEILVQFGGYMLIEEFEPGTPDCPVRIVAVGDGKVGRARHIEANHSFDKRDPGRGGLLISYHVEE